MKNRKPRIAVIGLKGLPAFGGAAKSIEDLVSHLSQNYNFTLYEISSHADQDYKIDNVNRKIFALPKFKRFSTFFYYFFSMYDVLFKDKYDLIITNHLYCGFIVPFLSIKYKSINIVHGIIPPDDNKWNGLDKKVFRRFEKLAVKFSTKVISVSKVHLEYLVKIGAANPVFIPNGISICKQPEYAVDEYISFAAARIISLKGCHTFLEAVRHGKIKNKIKIIGDIEQVQDYKQKLLSLSSKNVDFLGLVKDREKLFKIIAKSKLFIFPSFNEGMSNMLLEVASLKTPIICSDIIENKAIFSDDEVLFFNVGNYKDLSDKINFALNNYEVMIEKSINAFKRISKDYNWETISKQYINEIDKIIFEGENERNCSSR